MMAARAGGQADQPVTLAELERRAVEQAFFQRGGSATAAAKLLGIGPGIVLP
jgi:Bacterial regulatory protein, Fis family